MSEPQTFEDSNLNDAKAEKLFLEWYDTGTGYDYKNEPSKETAKNAGKFIVQQMMFVIMFSELLANCTRNIGIR